MSHPLREQWLQEYCEGTASAETTALLERALREDPEYRLHFLEYLNLDQALSSAGGSTQIETEPAPAPLPFRAGPSRWAGLPRWGALAAGLTLLALGPWVVHALRNPYAMVTSTTGNGPREGTSLRSKQVRFEAGVVEFLTAKGARIVVEAPADVHFESADTLRVLRGKVAADVPPRAKGFTVLTPNGNAVDLGTRFGVDVPESGDAEVHVFQGEVIAQATGAQTKQSLRTGEALAMHNGVNALRELRSAAFIQPDEMPQLSAGLAWGQRARAQTSLRALKTEPALIALLDFTDNTHLPGVFRMAQGRWPGSFAPEFVHQGDHLKLDVGAERLWPQLTLAAWVRLDQLGSPYHSLYHTDGWQNETPGQVHWMLTKDSRMRLALRGNSLAPGSTERDGFPDSSTSVLPQRGRWVHLATVYDADARSVRFYLNGQFDKETLQEVAHPARLGPAQIGNWNRQDRKLSGRMDEFLLLGRALNDGDIRELYLSGNPYH
jgi:ferric-dicitrate binding protein FerR (iron transport regulator)